MISKAVRFATAVFTFTSALVLFTETAHAWQSEALTTNAAPLIPVIRGRPHLNAARTTFVGDNGQQLRGPYTSTEWTTATSWQNIANMKNLGFNAVHLYAESFDFNYPTNGSTAPGYHLAEVDKIVAETRTNGLYLVITIGNGANNGNYNAAWITNFWNLYAPRYANETHVLFEIQNEPVAWGPPYSAANATPPGGLNMEIAAYKAIRANAPDTPVLLFTYAVFGGTGGASAALTDIHAFNTTVFGTANVVWTNEAVAFHGYNGWQGTSTAVSSLLNSGYPCFMTEYSGGAWGSGTGGLDAEMTSELERLGVSWTTFQYVPPSGVSDDVTIPSRFQNIVNYSGLSWPPDYGSWPPARAPYGNGGQPRTVPSSYVANFLSGTPVRIQAEDFDTGGEGVAYHELTTTNLGGQYRTNDAVDIETTTDTTGSYDVTGTAAGEWLEYNIWVPVAGYYNLSLRYASATNGAAVQVTGNGHDRTGRWVLPGTGSSSTWMTATQSVLLEFGRQILHLNVLNGGFNLNWLELTPASKGLIPNGTYKFLNAANGLVFTGVSSNNTVAARAYTGSTYQQWNLQHIGGNQYKITAVANGYSWNVNNGSLAMTSGWGTGGNQCFIIAPTGGGFYRIIPVSNGLPLETSPTNSAAIDQRVYSGSTIQQWALAAPSAPMFPTGLSATALSTTQVNLIWNAITNATSYNVKRSATSGGPYISIATGVITTNFTDTVPAGMKYYYVVTAIAGGVESPNSAEAAVNLPYPWMTQDIGAVGVLGGANFSNGVFTAIGSGADIWNNADALRFVYVPVTGNCTIFVRVTAVQNVDGWSKAGVMIRESLAANAINAYVAVTPGNGVTWQTRTTTGGATGNAATANLTAPYWVKLVRFGNTFTGFRSPDGVVWTQQGTGTFTMASTAYIGLALTSHNNSSLCTATFDNVTLPGWANVLPPAAPASLTAGAGNGQAALNWTASGSATSYNLKCSTTNGGPYVIVTNVATTSYTDSGLVNNTNYYYVVSALNDAGESTNSTPAIATPQGSVLSGLSAVPVSATQINLVWNSLTDATAYNVKRSTTDGGPYTPVASGVTGTNYSDVGLDGGTVYYYVVSAVVSGSETANSVQATATTFSPTLGSLIHRYGFSESGGTTVADSIGGPIWTGTLPNGGTFSSGQLTLSSAAQQHALLPAGIVSTLSNFTVMTWVRLNSTANWNRILDFGSGTTAYMFLAPQNGTDGHVRFAITTSGAGGEQQINSSATMTAGVWYQVAVTLNGNTGILYLNGLPVGTNNAITLRPSSLGNTVNNYLGRSQYADPYLDGLMDEFRIYNAGLSPAEIAATAALGPDQQLSTNSPPLGMAMTDTNLTMSWPLASPGFTLQWCTNLADGNWLNIPSPTPQIIGSQWQVVLPLSDNGDTVFYRLSK